MTHDQIITQIEDLMIHYRNAKLYGELFVLKFALELLKREVRENDD